MGREMENQADRIQKTEFAQLFFPFILTPVGKVNAFWDMLICLWLTEVLDTFIRSRSITGIRCQWEAPSLGLTTENKAYWNQPENNQVSSLLKEVR